MRALVIDDDQVYRLFLRSVLEGMGWTVDEAWDGQIGWQMYRLTDYDLVVSDIVMPHQEGLETIRLIRACRPDVPILAISGGSGYSAGYLRAARWFGADGVLAKPFSGSALQSAVDSVMSPTVGETDAVR